MFEQIRLPGLVRRHRIDVLHSLGYVSPLCIGCSSVVTIHDLNFIEFGNQMSHIKKLGLRFFVHNSVRRADFIITVSEYSRAEIIKAFHPPSEKIVVTFEASGVTGELRNHGSALPDGGPYIVAFSSVSPNKNIPNLLRAFAAARNRGLRHHLILVGHQPSGAELTTLSHDLSLGDSVIFTGYLNDLDLWNTLRSATLLVFPSVYEGFGLPVLEAMCLGVPVACSNRASLPEVGGTAALYFDPLSVEDMSEKIYTLASDSQMQEKLRREGLVNATRFSWERTARETLGVYERAVSAKRAG